MIARRLFTDTPFTVIAVEGSWRAGGNSGAGTAEAQTALVSHIGQLQTSVGNHFFITGSNPTGYILSTVKARFKMAPASVTVQLAAGCAAEPSNHHFT